MRVAFRFPLFCAISDQRHLEHRLDVGYSNVVFSRMREAIAQLGLDPASQETNTGHSDSNRQAVLRGTYLRDILLRSFYVPPPVDPNDHSDNPEMEETPSQHWSKVEPSFDGIFKDNMHIQSWAERYSMIEPLVIEGDPDLSGLNPTQVRAMAMMLKNRCSLVQGVRLSTRSDLKMD